MRRRKQEATTKQNILLYTNLYESYQFYYMKKTKQKTKQKL